MACTTRRDPNDRLLLGVKGTLFAAELHILRARMRGNLLNKARPRRTRTPPAGRLSQAR